MSWPLVLDLAHTGPMDRPDGRLNAWILAWAGTTLFEDPARLFDAPAFHPLKDALAFSENLLLPAAFVAPLQRASGPVLAYNVALLGSLLLSGLAVQLLVRRATGDRLAAFVAGAFFAAGAHRWTRLAHLHAQVTVFFPLALLALDRFWERRTLKRALVVGLMLALQGLSSVYLGAITATALGVAVLVALFGGLRVPELGRLAAGMLLAAALLWPVTASLPADARVPGPGVHARDGRDLRRHASVLRRGGNAALGAAVAAAARPHDDPRHAVPGPVRAGPGHRGPGVGAEALSGGRRRGLRGGGPVLAGSRDGVLPLPARAARARARRARARALRARAHARALRAGGPRARGPAPARGARGARADAPRIGQPAAAARALRRPGRGVALARGTGRARSWCCRSRRTTRSRCSTASRTGGRW